MNNHNNDNNNDINNTTSERRSGRALCFEARRGDVTCYMQFL